MSGQELQKALHDVEPGERAKALRFYQGSVVVRELRKGVVPASSPLSEDGIHVFVATRPDTVHDQDGELALALSEIADGKASLGIEPRKLSAARNVHFLRETIAESAHEAGVTKITIDPTTTPIPTETLQQVGFHPTKGGDTLQFEAPRAA